MDEPVSGSLQAYVLGEIRSRQVEVQKLPIKRLPRLVIRYGSVDPRELLRISLELQATRGGQVDKMLATGADLLLAACEGSETDKGDELGKKLGRELAEYLGIEPVADGWASGQDGEREALFLIFDDDIDVMSHVNKLQQLLELADEQAQDELVGNSGAVSTA